MPRPPNSSPQTLRVLAALLAAPDGWVHGYALSQVTGLASGTLYPILRRLAAQGWLEGEWRPSPEHGRPPRQLHRLTQSGAREARATLLTYGEALAAPERRVLEGLL